jgi:hypothetical protein
MNTNYHELHKSPEDKRDWKGEIILSNKIVLPSKLSYRKQYNKPRHQKGYPTCSAMASSAIKEWQEYNDVIGIGKPYFSPAFIYNHRRNYPDNGMYPRDTMKILQKFGTCLEDDYPYNKENIENHRNRIPTEIKLIAKNFKIKNYASLSTIEGVKKALKKNGPCYIALPMKNGGHPRFWIKENESDEYDGGGHAVTIVGYDDNKEIYGQKGAFEIRNSGGENFNDDGYCWFPYCDFGIQWSIWTAIDENSDQPEKNYYIKWANEYIKNKIKEFFKDKSWLIMTLGSLIYLLLPGVNSFTKWLKKFFKKKIKKISKKNKKYFYIVGGIIIIGIIVLIIF